MMMGVEVGVGMEAVLVLQEGGIFGIGLVAGSWILLDC